MTDVSDQISNGYVDSGLRFFSCDRCKKLSRCSDIVWAHKNELIPMERLGIYQAGRPNLDLVLCPACMAEFGALYCDWWEKKP